MKWFQRIHKMLLLSWNSASHYLNANEAQTGGVLTGGASSAWMGLPMGPGSVDFNTCSVLQAWCKGRQKEVINLCQCLGGGGGKSILKATSHQNTISSWTSIPQLISVNNLIVPKQGKSEMESMSVSLFQPLFLTLMLCFYVCWLVIEWSEICIHIVQKSTENSREQGQAVMENKTGHLKRPIV